MSAPKQFISTLQAINPVVFIQAIFTLAVEKQLLLTAAPRFENFR
jgi:hypothetical protein